MKVLITGAGGFIGKALWRHLSATRPDWLKYGIDNFVRPTASLPACSDGDEFYNADVNDIENLPLPNVDAVIHLAAQTSVTRSITSPFNDMRNNIEATVRLLLWIRRHSVREAFIYASTNKVFGELVGYSQPIDDSQPICPVTPYGVSKATAAFYVAELSREGYVFHQSCIYGEEQRGTEDQGWVGYLIRRKKAGQPITCFGDSSQVRDLLHVDDLIAAYSMALDRRLSPGAYIIGGGDANTFSFGGLIRLIGGTISQFAPWRPHDQRFFVSANRRIQAHGWRPRISARERIPAL